jgi:hypothetical protein
MGWDLWRSFNFVRVAGPGIGSNAWKDSLHHDCNQLLTFCELCNTSVRTRPPTEEFKDGRGRGTTGHLPGQMEIRADDVDV